MSHLKFCFSTEWRKETCSGLFCRLAGRWNRTGEQADGEAEEDLEAGASPDQQRRPVIRDPARARRWNLREAGGHGAGQSKIFILLVNLVYCYVARVLVLDYTTIQSYKLTTYYAYAVILT